MEHYSPLLDAGADYFEFMKKDSFLTKAELKTQKLKHKNKCKKNILLTYKLWKEREGNEEMYKSTGELETRKN